MIRLPSKAEMKMLETFKKPNCLSIYSPFIESNSPNNNPNRIQLKDLVKKSRELLSKRDLNNRKINKILNPINKLVDSEEFNSIYPHSLAIFANRGFFELYHLPPLKINPTVAVFHNFWLQPIDSLIKNNLDYYLLLLNQNNVKLFHGDKYRLRQVHVHKMPKSMLKELHIDEMPKERQLHTIGPVVKSRATERYHGQYNKNQTNKIMLLNFFRRIDRKIHRKIRSLDIPLIIAGVDYLLPIYRQVNTYPLIHDREIIGNYEREPIDSLRQKVCSLIYP